MDYVRAAWSFSRHRDIAYFPLKVEKTTLVARNAKQRISPTSLAWSDCKSLTTYLPYIRAESILTTLEQKSWYPFIKLRTLTPSMRTSFISCVLSSWQISMGSVHKFSSSSSLKHGFINFFGFCSKSSDVPSHEKKAQNRITRKLRTILLCFQ